MFYTDKFLSSLPKVNMNEIKEEVKEVSEKVETVVESTFPKPVHAPTEKEQIDALKAGHSPYIHAGYSNKDEVKKMRDDLTKKVGFPVRAYYNSTHNRYHFEKKED